MKAVEKMYSAWRIFSTSRNLKVQASWRNFPKAPSFSRRFSGTMKIKASTVAAMASTRAMAIKTIFRMAARSFP